jgi:hypothetical protein
MRIPQPVRSGVRILAEHYNAIVAALRQMQITVGPGLTAQQTPNGLMIGLDKRVSDQAKQQPAVGFFARIDHYHLMPDGIRYLYSFEKVQQVLIDGGLQWVPFEGNLALTGSAVNGAEFPTVYFRFSPVKQESIVRMFSTQVNNPETGKPVTHYHFYAAQNADTMLTSQFVPLGYSVTVPTLDTSSWSLQNNQGMGVSVPVCNTVYDANSGNLMHYERTLYFDATGRLMAATGQSLGKIITQAVNCP